MKKVLCYIAWALVALLCLLALVMSGSGVALVVLLAVVLVPLAGFAAVWFAAKKLQFDFSSPTTVGKGKQGACLLRFENRSLVPLPRVEAHVTVHNLLTGQEHESVVRASVLPKSTAEVPFDFASDLCGRVELSVDRVTCYEALSIMSKTRKTQALRRLSVMPELHDMYMRNVLAASPLADTTTYSPYSKGEDLSELFGIRDYEAGDDVRRIMWKLSEKTGQLVVKEPSLPIDSSLVLMWDKNLYGVADVPERADAMAELMLSLAQMLSSHGIGFDVACNDVETGRCMRESVTCEDDIYELIGHLMSSPLGQGAESCLASYLRFYGPLSASRVLYVCCSVPDGLQGACQGKNLMAFVCDDTADMVSQFGYTELHFAANDIEGAIALAEVV